MTRAVVVLLLLQVKQARTAAAYEKMVLRVNAWMVEQEYEPFAHTVEVAPGRYRVELLQDAGVPRVPQMEAVIEFLIGMSTGAVEKGGDRAARDTDVYGSPMWGKTQAEMFMPLAKKKKPYTHTHRWTGTGVCVCVVST